MLIEERFSISDIVALFITFTFVMPICYEKGFFLQIGFGPEGFITIANLLISAMAWLPYTIAATALLFLINRLGMKYNQHKVAKVIIMPVFMVSMFVAFILGINDVEMSVSSKNTSQVYVNGKPFQLLRKLQDGVLVLDESESRVIFITSVNKLNIISYDNLKS